jgi:3',5'-cyclic AMP phosphodiesterase CpdA
VVVLALSLLMFAAIAAVALGIAYRRQIGSYLAHRKGGPTETWSWEAHRPPPGLHIAVAGDVGDGGARIDATGAAVARIGAVEPYDLLLLLGDNVYPKGDPDRLPATVFEPFSETLDGGSELLAILGNHDVVRGHGDDQLAVLGMEGRWWERTYGDLVTIIGLDSTDIDAPGQMDFLEDRLAASSTSWRIVAVHHPPYSAGYQGSSLDIRDRLVPVLERHGVQLVLSGHDHDYQRSVPLNGVTYVVTGGASGTRRTGDDAFTAASWSWHHFTDIAVWRDRLVVRAVGQDGSVFDEHVLTAANG